MTEPTQRDREVESAITSSLGPVGVIAAYREECVKQERERVLDLVVQFSGTCDRYDTARNTLEALLTYIRART